MKLTTPLHRLTIVAGFLLAGLHLSAQTAAKPNTPPSPSATPSDEANSEVITLGTFDVSSANNHGYTSDESTTGTRIKANLRDLPFSVSVITSDFINDFANFDFNDQVSNVSSLSTSEEEGQYQLRGFVIGTQLVDGFRRLGIIDPVNIDRIEIIKGPAASVYGYIQPGGVVNILTKRPLTHQEDGLGLYAGSFDFRRAKAYSTGPVGQSGKVFYRVDLADQHQEFQQEFKATSRYYGAAELLFKPNDNTSLSVKVDYVFQHQHRGNGLAALRTTGIVTDPYRVFTTGATIGQHQTISNYFQGLAYSDNPYDPALYNFNNGGPEEYNDRRMTSAQMVFQHHINDIFDVREGFNTYDRHFYRLWVSGNTYNIPPFGTLGTLSGQQPEYDVTPQRNLANQFDLTAKFDTGPVSNQMLLSFDYSLERDGQTNLRMDSTNAALQPVNNVNPDNPAWGFTTFQQNPSLYDQQQSNYVDSVYNYGVFMNEHASMLNNRLNLIAGLRIDKIDTKLVDHAVYNYFTGNINTQVMKASLQHYATHQLGASFRIADPVTVFVNESTSINPQPNYIAGLGQLSPNAHSEGHEFGAKVSLLENRLNFTVSRYDINQYNAFYQITTTTTNPNGVSASTNSGIVVPRQVSRGYEADLNWNATKSLSFLIDYSYDEARVVESGNAYPNLVGTPTRRVPANEFGGAARYEFNDGKLKGLFFVVNEKFASKSLVDLSGGRAASGSGFVNNPLPSGILPWPNLPAGAAVPTFMTTRLGPGANPATGETDQNLVHLPDGREAIFNEPYWLTDIGVGYTFKTGKFRHKLQLNFKNIFNRQWTWGSGTVGNPLTYVGSYTLTF
jgi:iron complex outermembrane receptor protein